MSTSTIGEDIGKALWNVGKDLLVSTGAPGGICTCESGTAGTGSNGRVGILAPSGGIAGTTEPTFDPE